MNYLCCRSAHESGTFGESTRSSSSTPVGSSALSPNTLLSYTTGIMTGGGMGMGMGASSSKHHHNSHDDAGSGGVKFSENGTADKKTMLLFVVGGLSYIEIAACRFLSKDPSFPYRIMLATTKLVNGSTLIGSLKHNV